MPAYGLNGSTFNVEHVQLRFKNANQWTTEDVLLAGEIGVEVDTHKAKIGDGVTAWTALPYSSDPTVQTLVDTLSQKMTTVESDITSIKNKNTEQDERLTALEGITTISANSFSE